MTYASLMFVLMFLCTCLCHAMRFNELCNESYDADDYDNDFMSLRDQIDIQIPSMYVFHFMN